MKSQIQDFFQQIELLSEKQGHFPRFICDSRDIKPGDCFIAFKGERVDGHDFIEEAFKKGAILAICSENKVSKTSKHFVCQDPLNFIKQAACYQLEKIKPTIIGITGSCGKTTTRHFLLSLLEKSQAVFATPGNFNSQIGIPMALLGLRAEHRIAIIEMGMSHKGDILKLVDWIKLDYAIITSIGLSHAINFEDKDIGIAKAKGEILKSFPYSFFNEQTSKYEPFSHFTNRTLVYTDQIFQKEEGTFFQIGNQIKGPFILNLKAPHLLENLHLTLACIYKMGMSDHDIHQALKGLRTEEKRMEERLINQIEFIDDSYNASPASMKAAINYLKTKQSKRKIAVIGSMKELGDVSEKEHLKLLEFLKTGVDQVYFLGEETFKLYKLLGSKGEFFDSLNLLENKLKSYLQPGDSVLIKGSHSTGLHSLLNSLSN